MSRNWDKVQQWIAFSENNFTACGAGTVGGSMQLSEESGLSERNVGAGAAVFCLFRNSSNGDATPTYEPGAVCLADFPLTTTESCFVDCGSTGAFWIVYTDNATIRRCCFRDSEIGAPSDNNHRNGPITFSECMFSGAVPNVTGFIDLGGNLGYQTITTAVTGACAATTVPPSATRRASATRSPRASGSASRSPRASEAATASASLVASATPSPCASVSVSEEGSASPSPPGSATAVPSVTPIPSAAGGGNSGRGRTGLGGSVVAFIAGIAFAVVAVATAACVWWWRCRASEGDSVPLMSEAAVQAGE